ncbi:hypothetical protein DPMN_018061 [Dreissena polymorpha]|uniref:Uncharacterized protein n=1 Tax=Dreissena polymorpha TaxID=45954 RepID=A0A9D4S617_DREPO|nr:hypothetical protein DPMN_018061 [Dreissena polymorpha]
MYNVKEWTSLHMGELLSEAYCRPDWRRMSVSSSLILSQVDDDDDDSDDDDDDDDSDDDYDDDDDVTNA